MRIRNEKRAKQKITCKQNHFKMFGPPLTYAGAWNPICLASM
jgi:hypothetical protein